MSVFTNHLVAGVQQSYLPLASGKLISYNANSTNITVAANTIYAHPLRILCGQAFDRIGLHVTTGVAAGAAKIGIWADNNGTPSNLLLDCGTIATTTAENGTTVLATISGTFSNIIWLGVKFNGTPSIKRFNSIAPLTEFIGNSQAGNFGFCDGSVGDAFWSLADTYANALPSSLSSATRNVGLACPILTMRAA